MKQVNIYEAKTHLSSLVEEAAAGEVVVIAKNGKPCARLVALEPARETPRREFGFWKALYPDWLPPEVFPEFTDAEISEWENNPVFPVDRA